MLQHLITSALAIIVSALVLPVTAAQPDSSSEQGLYQNLPETTVHTVAGDYSLASLYQDTPLIIAPIFTRCAGICSPFLAGLNKNLEPSLKKNNIRVLVFSFDPADTPKDMQSIAKHFKLEGNPQWIFGTVDDIDILNKTLSFRPEWDEKTQQFEHEALTVGVNRRGSIVRKLTGLPSPQELGRLVREICGGFQVSYPLPRPGTIFTCFSYDPASGKTRPSLGLLIMGLPALATGLMLTGISTAARRRRDR